ncbi:Protein of unknown function [Pyronema omphalodes CBS 100304]|uniref:Uncharacterized protein n=1 Tax=Pyronema omphalodes (strain CBS 100304) TaxID=1076935 RepID=U4LXP7_PYROM|nr:Protein of unknown function [Pyronema omphalodes CBS 100304]
MHVNDHARHTYAGQGDYACYCFSEQPCHHKVFVRLNLKYRR